MSQTNSNPHAAVIPRIREVHLRNYRSIQQAVVRLSDFTVLVGPNGSGKSNFMDALAFVQECLSTSLQAALRSRGGILHVRYGVREPAVGGVGIRLVMDLTPTTVADYAFELVRRDTGAVDVVEERCSIDEAGRERHGFAVLNGQFEQTVPGLRPALEPDRLALYAASALPEFRPVYNFLSGMQVYAIRPERLRDLRDSDSGFVLESDGGNAPAVFKNLQEHHPDRYQRVRSLLRAVVPGIDLLNVETVSGKQFLLFEQATTPGSAPFPLTSSSISDGTLRMLGLLLAVYQPTTPAVLVIEEPEATIHPAAVDVVMSVLLDAAKRSQVLVTTHSPDVLDHKALPDEAIRVVARTEHGSVIAPLANASRQAIRERLYTPGELLRSDELNPDVPAAESLAGAASLFGEPLHTSHEVG